MNPQNDLIGKIAEVKFETGYHFKLEYLVNDQLKWTSLNDKSPVKEGTENITLHKQNDGIYTINRIEDSGTSVTHNLDLNKNKVWAFMSWNDESQANGRASLSHQGEFHFITPEGAKDSTPFTNLQIVSCFWNEFFNEHREEAIDKYLAAPYTQHHPAVADGVEPFRAAFMPYLEGVGKDSSAKIVRIASNDDLVYVHNNQKMVQEGLGNAAIDIFRLKDKKIIEHWDVIQAIPEEAANDHPMF